MDSFTALVLPLGLAALPQEVALGLEVREPGAVRPPEAEQLAVPRRGREPVVVHDVLLGQLAGALLHQSVA